MFHVPISSPTMKCLCVLSIAELMEWIRYDRQQVTVRGKNLKTPSTILYDIHKPNTADKTHFPSHAEQIVLTIAVQTALYVATNVGFWVWAVCYLSP